MKEKGDEKRKKNKELHNSTLTNKQSEESLDASREKFELAFKHSPIGICMSTLRDGRYVEVNDVYCNFLGYSREELIGRTSSDINLWVDMAERDALVREIFQNGSVVGFELRFRDRNGKIHWGYTSAAPVKIGEESYLLTQTQDITEKKQIEEEFEKRQVEYRLLADNVTDAIFTIDMNFHYTYASPSTYNIIGYTGDELTTMKVEQLVDSETLGWFAEMFAEELEIETRPDRDLKRSRVLEYQHVRKDGSKVWVENKLTFLRDENNKAVGMLGIVRDITERKLADNELRKSERFFKEISENSSDIIIITDENGIIKYCSPSMERFAGYKPDEVIGKNAFTFIHPEEAKRAVDEYGESINKKDSILPPNSFRIIHKDGSVRYFAGSGKILLDNPDVAGVIMNVHDVTDQKMAEEALTQSTENYRKFFEDHASPGIIIDPDTRRILYVNHAAALYYGWTREEMLQMKMDQINTLSSEEINDEIKKVLNHEKNRFEAKHHLADGSTRYVEVFSSKINVEGTDLLHSIVYDITERKQAEESGKQSEEKYRTILENMQEGYFEIDLAGSFIFVNNSTCRDLGYSREELIGMNNRQYTNKETQKKLFQTFHKVYKTGEPLKGFQWQIIKKDGSIGYTEGSISLKKDSSGKPIGFTGVAHDITERKQAEESGKQSEEKYRLLADHMKDQVWLMDMNLKISYVSPSAEKLLGYSFEELRDLPLDKLLTAESLKRAMDFHQYELAKALAAPSDYVLNRSLELQFCCKDGHSVWGETMFSFIRDENGKPVSILGEGRNITERKQMEDTLSKSEENFRHSLDDSPLGVRISTVEGKTLYANRAILDIYGYENVEELENTPLQKRYTPETYAEFQIRKKKRLRGESGPSEYEVSIIRKNGEIGNLYVFRKEIFWNGQKQSQVIYQDITLRRQAEEKLSAILENLRQSIKITIQVLGTAAEARDPYMAGHQKRVADLARAIATEMKLPHDKIEAIRMAGAIHDIGKISIPSEILCKPAILSDLEFSFIKNHPQYSYDIIKDVESPWPLADIVHQHHERIDGSGYPQGLKNEDILIESRILAVADVVEAMVSYRPYRPALELELALTEIENNAGILYDRNASDACLRLFREKGYQISS